MPNTQPLFSVDEILTLEQVRMRLRRASMAIVLEIRDYGDDIAIVYNESDGRGFHCPDDSPGETFGFLYWTMDGRVYQTDAGLTLNEACQRAFHLSYVEVSVNGGKITIADNS